MQDTPKAVWSIPYVSVAFFPSLKQNFIAYRSSEVSDCIFEIHQLWQSGFSKMYSNCCCSCSFEAEIIRIGQSSHKMYSNNILNFQESTTILNTHLKKVWKLIVCTSYHYPHSPNLLILARIVKCHFYLFISQSFCFMYFDFFFLLLTDRCSCCCYYYYYYNTATFTAICFWFFFFQRYSNTKDGDF